jgi:hypothetical protein
MAAHGPKDWTFFVFFFVEIDLFQERDVVLTLDDIRFLTSGYRITEDQMDQVVTKLLELKCKIIMLRTAEGVKVYAMEKVLI